MEPQETLEPASARSTFLRIFALSGPPYGLLMGIFFGGAMHLAGRFDPVFAVGMTLAMAVFFGAFFGLAMLPMLREVSVRLPASDRDAFVSRLNAALKEVHYLDVDGAGSFWVSWPKWRAGSLAGAIRVGLDDSTATLVGPRRAMKKVEDRLRLDP
jgi:hypothetical protein